MKPGYVIEELDLFDEQTEFIVVQNYNTQNRVINVHIGCGMKIEDVSGGCTVAVFKLKLKAN